MPKLALLFLLLATMTGCANNAGTVSESQTNTPVEQPTSSAVVSTPDRTKELEVATVKDLVQGDLICYATLLDENNIEHNVGASFEICADSEKFLNQKVRLGYEEANINDCQSNEPCGKTRKEKIVTTMEIIR